MPFAVKGSLLRPALKWGLSHVLARPPQPRAAAHLPAPKKTDLHIYPDSANANNDLHQALTASAADHKCVLVIFGANWCADCQALEAAMRTNELAALVATNYHIVHVNVDEGNSNTDLARRFKVPLKRGIPALAVLDASGRLITSQRNGEFQSGTEIGLSDISGFLIRWKP